MQFSLLFLSLVGAGNAILLPKPSGPYGTALRIQGMTDKSRIDPYDPKKGHRQVLVSIFWPVDSASCSNKVIPYMPPAAAKAYGQQVAQLGLSNDTFSALELQVCKTPVPQKGCASEQKSFPVAFFSPGAGYSRLLYNLMASSLASYGNIVVLIDSPYDPPVVEFPDGQIIYGGNIPDDKKSNLQLASVKAKDMSFTISEVLSPSFQKKVFKGLPGSMDNKKVVALGHSIGGASAAIAMLSDNRIHGGMDLDGQIFEPALSKGLDKPFFLIGRPNHAKEDITWTKFWPKLRGPKKEISINDTTHGSFTDYPQIVKALNLPEAVVKALQEQIGTAEPSHLQKFLSKTVVNYMEISFASNGKN
ncbi:PAF acetylhydrolase family [Fusarium subglutinans]|uniref:1-alkyl-2-acetylglycerophosphocholine esterase n=1 Tax=Gibberella subglutinans TaxID=42677 RepID=A0A8H5Q6Y5_GIBSU|nr:PAF acetylhydrolase family [Fusarium subglutinans]KAF5608601.1 PAF acetylhydrolase family [Fusarium subglutinans]